MAMEINSYFQVFVQVLFPWSRHVFPPFSRPGIVCVRNIAYTHSRKPVSSVTCKQNAETKTNYILFTYVTDKSQSNTEEGMFRTNDHQQ